MTDRPANPRTRAAELPGTRGLLLRGFAPLALLVVLVLAAILFAPSVAPERYVPVTADLDTTEAEP